jgi:hypothetical protein
LPPSPRMLPKLKLKLAKRANATFFDTRFLAFSDYVSTHIKEFAFQKDLKLC